MAADSSMLQIILKTKNMAKIEKSGIGVFSKKLITAANLSCK